MPNYFITTGQRHALGIRTCGSLWGWGANSSGQLGLGNIINSIIQPSKIGTDIDWQTAAASEFHTMGIRSNTLWAWGWNDMGQLGIGTSGMVAITNPTQVGTDNNWEIVACGDNGTMAIRTDNTLWGWGSNNFGQLGLGNTITPVLDPSQVGTDSNWSDITYGGNHAIGLRTNGTLWGWGRNNSGQLGLGNTITPVLDPSQVGSDTNWSSIVCRSSHSLGLRTNETLWGWGNNTKGQLGLGHTTSPVLDPSQVGTDTNWSSVACGVLHTIGIRTNGTLWGWGDNFYGQLGLGYTDGAAHPNPEQIGTDTDWIYVSCNGYGYTLAIKEDSSVWGWGSNDTAQLCLGYDSVTTAPTKSTIWTWNDCPPPPPIPKNLKIKWNTVKNSKYIRFPYEDAYAGLIEQQAFDEYTDGYNKRINVEKVHDPTK